MARKGNLAAAHAIRLIDDVMERSARDNYIDTGDAIEALSAARKALAVLTTTTED